MIKALLKKNGKSNEFQSILGHYIVPVLSSTLEHIIMEAPCSLHYFYFKLCYYREFFPLFIEVRPSLSYVRCMKE